MKREISRYVRIPLLLGAGVSLVLTGDLVEASALSDVGYDGLSEMGTPGMGRLYFDTDHEYEADPEKCGIREVEADLS